MDIQRFPSAQPVTPSPARVPKDRDPRRQNQQGGQSGEKGRGKNRQALEDALDELADQLNQFSD